MMQSVTLLWFLAMPFTRPEMLSTVVVVCAVIFAVVLSLVLREFEILMNRRCAVKYKIRDRNNLFVTTD